jgi:hypothetical protein
MTAKSGDMAIFVSWIPTEPVSKGANDSAILKTKAVVQPVAIDAPIWSNSDYKSQLCEPLSLLPIHFPVTVGTSPMVVSR